MTTCKGTPKLHTLHHDLSSADYHSLPNSYSSTQIKDLLGDEEYFYKKHVAKMIPRESMPAFDVGSYFHTGVLEPHKLSKEFVTFGGAIRRGEVWDDFCRKNTDKIILTTKERDQALALIEATNRSTVAKQILSGGYPEVSMFVELLVKNGEIFAPHLDLFLTREGWYACGPVPKDGLKFVIKVRADYLGDGYVADLKSTSGNAKDEHTVKSKVSQFNYDLSAALYLDMFSAGTGVRFDRFYWIFASKDYGNCKTWLASRDNIRIGRAKWSTAILKLANCIQNGWSPKDEISELEPNFYEREFLKDDSTDLLT